MPARSARRLLPAVALVTAGLAALAACGPGTSSGAASPASSASTASSASAGSSPSGTASTSPSAPAGSPASPGAAPASRSQGSAQGSSSGSSGGRSTASHRSAAGASVPACATSRLRTTVRSTGAGAGHATYQLVFQNTGPAPCALRGYPGVSFVKIHNIQLGKAAARTPAPVTIVTLIPGAHAYADLETVYGQGGYDAAQCGLTTVPTLRVYPPNQTESTQIPWNLPECVAPGVQNLQVGPVHGNR